MNTTRKETLLDPIRVLDLSNESGYLCGKLLADMGGDVVKVEPPGGDSGRGLFPHAKGENGADVGLYWLAYNINKRSITLNLKKEDGQTLFRKLAERADIIIETFAPGYLVGLGLGCEALSVGNPKLIMTSITPFGQDGPYANYRTTDLVNVAMGGMMSLCGDDDRPPVRTTLAQSYVNVGAQAATATLLALYQRGQSGRGQYVDFSIQEAVLTTTYNAPIFREFGVKELKRSGPCRTGFWNDIKQRTIFKCQDGYVSHSYLGGALGASRHKALTAWMEEEGGAPQFMKDTDWDEFDMRAVTPEQFGRLEKAMVDFVAPRHKEELFEQAIKRNIILFPLSTSQDILDDPQLVDREIWAKAKLPGVAESVPYPKFWVKASEG